MIKLYTNGEEEISAKEVVEATGVSRRQAHRRLAKWQIGLISKEKLFYKREEPRPTKTAMKLAEEALALEKVKGETPFEKAHPEIFER